MSVVRTYFRDFLETAFLQGDYTTDDVIAFILPVLKEVIGFHEEDRVAPFDIKDSLFVTGNSLDIDEKLAHRPKNAIDKINKISLPHQSGQFDVEGKGRIEVSLDDGQLNYSKHGIHTDSKVAPVQPAYVRGYQCYEILLGHHDAQTDIFCLGLVIGSMALGLDLYDEEDLKLFVQYRANPVQFNERIHPTLGALVTEMTELSREKRAADLYEIVSRLEHYREYDPAKQADLSNVAGWLNKELKDRSQLILNKLRNRLFDTSRRNRLLYYKPNMRFVNLTVSSVPTVLHYQSINPELLFTWNNDIADKITGMKELVLNKYLRFEDHLYLPSSLDKIRAEAKFDVQEYGFSQLKLVVAFLNWHNLKEETAERIQSPLLLLPVELKKNKRLKEDHYVLNVLDNTAEINPVLANQLRELYGIILPDFIDLEEMRPEQFYQLLKGQVDGANQGIQLKYYDKPRIKLVQTIARQTVVNYKKRLRKNANTAGSYKDIPYSYHPENYKPLGLELFHRRVELKPAELEQLIGERVNVSSGNISGETSTEQQLYSMAESENNPYSWDFDLCNMVLGNFNYKKMSLVRDYNQVIDRKMEHPVFEELFSNKPRHFKNVEFDLSKPDEWHQVIAADPTQTQAVMRARTGENYIIQGPPGTGKSQTITNLIADFVAQGKNVLFVCEKRAALDVVYHRLKQNGLDELCCYIHDSQADKRSFIKNLKQTYETFIACKPDLNGIKVKRSALVNHLNNHLEKLQSFHAMNVSVTEEAGINTRALIERLIELKNEVAGPGVDETLIPDYKLWKHFGETIHALGLSLQETGAEPIFAEHPLSGVNDQVFQSDDPQKLLNHLVNTTTSLLREVSLLLTQNNISHEHAERFENIRNLVQDAVLLFPLAESDNLQLVNRKNTAARHFDQLINDLQQKKRELEKAELLTSGWKNKFSSQDVGQALEIARKNEHSFFRFLNGSWKRLKKKLHESYDFQTHAVPPTYSFVLEQLQTVYEAANSVATTRNEMAAKYRLDNPETAYVNIEVLRGKEGDKEIDYLLQLDDANNVVKRLYKLSATLHQLETLLQKCLVGYEQQEIAALFDRLENISLNSSSLGELLPALRDFARMPEELKQAVRQLAITPLQGEALMARKTLGDILRYNKSFEGLSGTEIGNIAGQIETAYQQLLKINAAYVGALVHEQFLQHLELSNIAQSQLNAEQKQFKKTYSEGRKILENEFGKSMRYKSIRELLSKESGLVLKDLKPVWLMSPLSVSDSLPIDTAQFDVVIFDEASQITLEEGIPALYRAPQTIIVGDDKQMPPTNFFSAAAEDPDDLDVDPDEDDDVLSTDADSLLVQGCRKLNSTMLCWHYRSRYETLISYSNHAFYEAGLLTIPDKTIHHDQKPPIIITDVSKAVDNIDHLFNRSISFHYLPEGVYEKRSNQGEAAYIAELVRELLKRKVPESIGIVAFSQEQQHTIEHALENLATKDNAFEQLLEDAYNRYENEQFVGLIIKNLENIQGDERDIIIMSICYGFDSNKKMIMNFGPINRKGGEKRLNVIFSRAKKHMAIISSIKHHNITNEYNEGASYFRRFLQYAEMVSEGNMQMARAVLDGLILKKNSIKITADVSVITTQIRFALEQKGFKADEAVGQSGFKCSLAIKATPGDANYRLGILIDDNEHYQNSNILEQYFQRPAILKSFGWNIIRVFAKDWLLQPEKVIENILKKLQVEKDDQETEDDQSIQELPVKELSTLPDGGIYANLYFTRLENTSASGKRFWEIARDVSKLVIRFGKVDNKGQVQVKTFSGEDAAIKEMEKLIQEKKEGGYL